MLGSIYCFLFGLLLLNSLATIKNHQSFGVTVTNSISLKKFNHDAGDLSQWQCKEYTPTNILRIKY